MKRIFLFFCLSAFLILPTVAQKMIVVGHELIRINKRNGIEFSSNAGLNWTQRYRGNLQTGAFISIMEFDSDLYACTSNGVFVSSNKGLTWLKKSAATATTGDFRTIVSYRGELIAHTSKGVFYSRDRGITWIKRSAKD